MKITLSEHPLLRQWIQEGKRIIPPDEIEIDELDYERIVAQSFETHPRYTSEQRQAWSIYNCWEPEDSEMSAPPSDGHPETVISTNRIEKHLLGIQLAMASEASKLAVEISDSSKSASKELIGAIQEFSDQNTESLHKVSQVIKTGFDQASSDFNSCILRLDQMVDYAGRFDIFLRETIFSLRASFKWGKVFWILDLLLKTGMVLLLWLLLSGKAQAQGRGTSFLDCINFDDAAGVELFGPCSPFRIREGSNITFSLSGETLTISGPAASGITTLNTLSGAIQTFATGTAGADFGISSVGTTHTFNIPSSSALNRGLLVAADWSTFNGKENVLTFSTGLTRLVNAVSCDTASALQLGCLSAADWSTFNGKQDALGFTPVPDTRLINTTAPLGGGGALSGDLTLTCTGCLTSVTAHALLSATHTGTVAAAPVRGDIIIANLTPAWTKLALGAAAAGRYARSDGTDVVISTGSASGVGACAASNWASTLNADAAPTCTQPAASDLSNGVTGSGAVVLATTPTFVTSALSPIFSTTTADPADAGILRLANGETICWEASPTGADFCITGNASEQIAATTFAGALVGNSDTTTALAADPAGCTAGGLNFTNDINTAGTSTCADVRTASTAQTGIAELATTAEVAAGADTGRTVTPSGIAPSIQTGAYLACSDAGVSDAYTCTMTPTLTAYTTGMQLDLRVNTANTGAATVNVDSLGARTIVKLGGGIATALADNDLRAGQWTLLVYDGTNFQMQGQLGNAGGGAGGYATIQSPPGTALTQRTTLAARDGLSAEDESGNTRTDIDFDPADPTIIWLKEEFITNSTSNANMGELGWEMLFDGSQSITRTTGSIPNLGQYKVGTNYSTPASGNRAAFDLPANGQGNYFGAIGNTTNYWKATFVFSLDETTLTSVYVGAADTCLADLPSNFIGTRFDTGASDTAFQFLSRSGGASTVGTTGVNVDTAFHTLIMYSDGTNAKVLFTFDGGAVNTICAAGCDITATPPTAALGPCFLVITRTSAVRNINVDFMGFKMRLSTNANRRQ